MTDTWHAPPDLLARFATDPASIEAVTATSVEQHLVVCETCQRAVAVASDDALVQALWDDIADAVDRAQRTRAARLAHVLGFDHSVVRLVVATSSLQLQAVGAVIALAVGAFWAAGQIETSLPFVGIAPLAVLAIVALAFLPATEPSGEIAPSTPIFGFRLFVRRTVAVLAACLVPLGAASLALPGDGLEAFAWLLPSLAMALVSLALSERYRPVGAAVLVATAWCAVLLVARVGTPTPASMVDHLAQARPQFAAAALAAAAIASLVRRRDSFDLARNGGLLP